MGRLCLMLLLVFLVAGSFGRGFAVAAEPVIHTVQPGETISSIAEQYGVTPDLLASANGIADPNLIKVGQQLTIPGSAHAVTHRVAAGDNLFRLADQYGFSVDAILRANGLIDPDLIVVGQDLVIPGASTTPATPTGSSAQPAGDGIHTVAPGETVSGIAMRYGVSVGEIARVNELENPNAIQAGQTLVVTSGRARPLSARGGPRPAATSEPAAGRELGVFQVTYYCLQSRMSSGRWPYAGAAAADRSVLPIGTRLRIAGLGDFTVEDRFAVDLGRKRVDVWTESCAEAAGRGFEYRQVTVLGP